MIRRLLLPLSATFGVALLLSVDNRSQTQEVPAQPAGVEVQARGPVHEAFAQPDTTQPLQGPVIPKQPPDPIDEIPPDQKPAGDNVQWIPGYWAWDDDTNDFLWVSGCWRAVPPGRRWMPGHWQEIDKGWLWVSGFWAQDNVQQVQYLPPPPPTLDKGPSAPAPNDNSFYAPGCWFYQTNRYFWRPGHWVAFQPNWVWIPAHYVWTPTGCLFIEGYWDHPLEECGMLFAPCRFDLRVWLGARRPFCPDFVIHVDFLIGALFVHRGSCHYYFGDYFDDRYLKRGFVAWTDYHPHQGVVDPLFNYYSHQHRGEPLWEPALRDLYRGRFSGAVPRPPRTLVEQFQTIKTLTANKKTNIIVNKNIHLTQLQNVSALAPLKEVNKKKVTILGSLSQVKDSKIAPHVVKTQTVSKDEISREQKVATQMRQVADTRRTTEAKMLVQGGVPVKHTDAPKVVKVEMPKPPPHVVTPAKVVRTPPVAVVVPKHEVREIPKYEPPHPPSPPKKEKKG